MPTVDWIAVTTCPGTAEKRTTMMLVGRRWASKSRWRKNGVLQTHIQRLPCLIMRATQA